MKRLITSILSVVIVMSLFSACSSKQSVASVKDIDVDLTTLSQTMIYAEVNNMMIKPEDYMDKKVKIKGNFAVYDKDDGSGHYFACIIPDATACCQQGIEFVTEKELKYPDDYPDVDTEIEVVGTFTTYKEGELEYLQLKDSIMEPTEQA